MSVEEEVANTLAVRITARETSTHRSSVSKKKIPILTMGSHTTPEECAVLYRPFACQGVSPLVIRELNASNEMILTNLTMLQTTPQLPISSNLQAISLEGCDHLVQSSRIKYKKRSN